MFVKKSTNMTGFRNSNNIALFFLDIIFILISVPLSVFLYSGLHFDIAMLQSFIHSIPVLMVTYFCVTLLFREYNIAYRRLKNSIVYIWAAIVLCLLSAFLSGALTNKALPAVLYLMACCFSGALVWLLRVLFRCFLPALKEDQKGHPPGRVMIIGAGEAGSYMIRDLYASRFAKGKPIIVVDDDAKKMNTRINDVPILGGISKIPELVRQFAVDEIIIAIPSATLRQHQRIVKYCTQTDCKLKTMPPVYEIRNGQAWLTQMRDININDLLCRDEVKLDPSHISGYINGNVVLVTGGGGSIGSELCRQIAKYNPELLLIFDIYENNAYELQNELLMKYGNRLHTKILIGSVQDKKRVEAIFDEYRPDVVFHAAAHKHVPLMEDCPAEAVKNNVFGTLNVARCADKYATDRFVLLSTDKAVNPTNVMGATKRVAELIIQHFASVSKTSFMAVRFGNVLGSNGSVVPLFINQIASGGPVTVTHPDITRYFMTIPEASRLVLQAASMADSGSIYVLDMGDPVKIDDLARNMIKLMGYRPDVDIMVQYVGLRPGEKLYEELIFKDECEHITMTTHNRIMVVKPLPRATITIQPDLDALYNCVKHTPEEAELFLQRIVPIHSHGKPTKQSERHVDVVVPFYPRKNPVSVAE